MRKKTTARVMTVILAATIAFSNMTAVTTVYAADEEINVDAGEEYSNSVEQDNAPVEQNNTSAEQPAAEQNNAPAEQNQILAEQTAAEQNNAPAEQDQAPAEQQPAAEQINAPVEQNQVSVEQNNAPAELPREIERNMQISDSVLRYLTVRYEGELPAKREPLKPYVARDAQAAEAAPVAAPAPVAEPESVAEVVDDEKPESEAE